MKHKTLLFAFFVVALGLEIPGAKVSGANAQGSSLMMRDFSTVQCPEVRQLAEEILELEVSGRRLPTAKLSCLADSRFKHLRVTRPPRDAKGFSAAERFVDEERPFVIKSLKQDEPGLYQLDFIYRVAETPGGSISEVEDFLLFRTYNGKTKMRFGCAAVLVAPRSLVIRQSCSDRR